MDLSTCQKGALFVNVIHSSYANMIYFAIFLPQILYIMSSKTSVQIRCKYKAMWGFVKCSKTNKTCGNQRHVEIC